MKIHIATDHAGLEISAKLQKYLLSKGYEVEDHGPKSFDPLDDYPAFCVNAAQAVIKDIERGIKTLGIVFGGSGNGEQIAANKVSGIRAALVWNHETAALAIEHNNANVVALGARQHTENEIIALIETVLSSQYIAEERHARRIAQIYEYELNKQIVINGEKSIS